MGHPALSIRERAMITTKTWRLPLLVLLCVTAIGLGAGVWLQQRGSKVVNPYEKLGGDFTLASAHGPVSLSDYRNKVVMLFFGYTSCPDVCPTDLARMSAVFDQLSDAETKRVVGMFVSVDTDRDTPEHATKYAAFFHKRIMGLSGSAEAVAAVAKQYYVLYQRVDTEDSALGYTLDHSATTYLIGPQGKVRDLVRHRVEAQEMVEAVRTVLAG